jgi:hypothetical protein
LAGTGQMSPSAQESLSFWVPVTGIGGTGTNPNTAALVRGFIAALCRIMWAGRPIGPRRLTPARPDVLS